MRVNLQERSLLASGVKGFIELDPVPSTAVRSS